MQRQPFATPVECTAKWLSASSVSIGYSFGTWLLLGALQHCSNSHPLSQPMILLSPILGPSTIKSLGFIPPRSKKIRHFLGLPNDLSNREDLPCLSAEQKKHVFFLFGERDGHSSPKDRRLLKELGFSVTILKGVGHGLTPKETRCFLKRCQQTY